MRGVGRVFRRKDGRYCAKVEALDGGTKYVYGKSEEDVQGKIEAAVRDKADGLDTDARLTVGKALTAWLENSSDTVSDRTYANRECIVRVHLESSSLWKTRLDRLQPEQIRAFYRSKTRAGLSPATVGRMHAFLKAALEECVRSRKLRHNPAALVKPPKKQRRDVDVLTPEELSTLFETVRGTRYELPIVLGATAALRVGEALSVRWEDVDFRKGALRVRRTLYKGQTLPTKTTASDATLKLPRIALEALERHWEEQGRPVRGWVASTRNGRPFTAPNFHIWGWKHALKRAGLDESLHFHDLRHGCASLLLSRSTPITAVSRYLRHRNPNVTLTTYSHFIEGMEGLAADSMDATLDDL